MGGGRVRGEATMLQPHCTRRIHRVGAPWIWWACLTVPLFGCQLWPFGKSGPAAQTTAPNSTPANDRPASKIPDADTSFTLEPAPKEGVEPPIRAVRAQITLAVFNIQVPESQFKIASAIWNHIREDVVDSETQARLADNGFRIGIGNVQFWDPVKTILDGVPNRRVVRTTPVRVPIGFPLSLELDPEPRDQTLFYVNRAGDLSGSAWPQSRNILRATYAPDPRSADKLLFQLVPEVHQKLDGWRWIRTEQGLWQVPRQDVHPFDVVGVTLTLAKDEFIVVAPSDAARIHGIVGRAMLTNEIEGVVYQSYVFMRPEVSDVGQHD